MKAYTSRLFEGIPVGLWIWGSICTTWIYRVRRGLGFYGTEVGEQIQDKYPYFIPRSICNPEGQHSRDVFAAAKAAWKILPDEEKKTYNAEVKRKRLNMWGENLFLKNYMKDNL